MMIEPETGRQTDTALDPMFLRRWSPRAYDGSVMPEADLRTIFDAGRWAPSCYNYQPWRFLYATRDSGDWERFLSCLIPFNQSWVKNASVLIFITSERTMGAPDKPNYDHSFDAGAAWAMMALQAQILGYHAHGMAGVDHEKTLAELKIPETYRLECAVAIGRQADPEILPDALRAREKPSDRKALSEVMFAGNFPH
jgi:nitroreductase